MNRWKNRRVKRKRTRSKPTPTLSSHQTYELTNLPHLTPIIGVRLFVIHAFTAAIAAWMATGQE